METVAPEIIYYSRFVPSYNSGGGSRRLLQMLDLLTPLSFELVNEAPPKGTGSKGNKGFLARRVEAKSSSRFLEQWDASHRSYVGQLWNKANIWAAEQEKRVSSTVVMMDDPIYFLPLFRRAREESKSIIAVCHNLESLSPAQIAGGHQRLLLQEELDLLGQCDLVITISREETFLLQNLGISATYLPYFPPERVRARLADIRARRTETPKNHFLLLGTANNPATRQGMLAMIQAWEELGLGTEERQLLVAGYGTDRLQDHRALGVSCLGPLPDDELDLLLGSIKGCLCFQAQGAGALTRITEMLLAGVPVVANAHAARSYHNLPGIIEFSKLPALGEALDQVDAVEGKIPLPSAPEVANLRAGIRGLIRS